MPVGQTRKGIGAEQQHQGPLALLVTQLGQGIDGERGPLATQFAGSSTSRP